MVYVHARSNNMQYLCVSIIDQTMTWITGALTRPHNLLMHVYTHVFVYIYSVRLGGGGLFFIREGPWAPFHKILEATLLS